VYFSPSLWIIKIVDMIRSTLFLLSLSVWWWACTSAPTDQAGAVSETIEQDTIARDRPQLLAAHAAQPIVLDGNGTEEVWQAQPWLPMDHMWLGELVPAEDCSGRYRLAWDERQLYVLAEIVDDTLIDIHPDGLDRYWDDDCLEIFVDEDRSGGNHQYNHNAFAYHIALDGNVVDVGADSTFRYYNQHLSSARLCRGDTCWWEVGIRLYPDTYQDDQPEMTPLRLAPGKVMGFALAYCDNDHSTERENFLGNAPVYAEDKNRGWIDAGIFARLELAE
jgi:hypothetical protein